MSRLGGFDVILQIGNKYLGVSMLEVERGLPHTLLSGELHLLIVAGHFECLQFVEGDFYDARARRGVVRCYIATECALTATYGDNFLTGYQEKIKD